MANFQQRHYEAIAAVLKSERDYAQQVTLPSKDLHQVVLDRIGGQAN